MEQSRVFVGMVLILIFGEVLGLYGYVFQTKDWKSSHTFGNLFTNITLASLIVALILNTKSRG
ncbi:hypothetical protein D7V77_42755 [Corallococcus sp. CA041A]|nr:hypothetical protein D7V77_42755 [Corallococcus sp. CA041A]